MTKLLFLFLFLLDRLIKMYAVKSGEFILNKGLALGLFSDLNLTGFLYTGVLISISLFYWHSFYREKKHIFAFSMIISGAVSNLIDRFLYNGVVDYLIIWKIPAFNLADCFIVVGVLTIFIKEIFNNGKNNS